MPGWPTTALRAIGISWIVGASLPRYRSEATGLTSPKRWFQPSIPDTFTAVSESLPNVLDILAPSVPEMTLVDLHLPDTTLSSPSSTNERVRLIATDCGYWAVAQLPVPMRRMKMNQCPTAGGSYQGLLQQADGPQSNNPGTVHVARVAN